MYKLAVLFAAVAVSVSSQAALISESVVGDFSNDPLAPTSISFDVGTNGVIGSVTSINAISDTRDFFTFTIGPDQLLTSIDLISYTDGTIDLQTGLPNPGNRGFVAIDEGTTSLIPTGGANGNGGLGLLGGAHLEAGDDVSLTLSTPELVGPGFEFPLGAGDYTFLVQQTGQDFSDYYFTFEVSQVPLPAAAWLFISGLMGLFGLKRFRSQKP